MTVKLLFCYCYILEVNKLHACFNCFQNIGKDCTDRLTELFLRVHSKHNNASVGINGYTYRLTDAAGQVFEDYFNSCEQEITKLIEQGYSTYEQRKIMSGVINKSAVSHEVIGNTHFINFSFNLFLSTGILEYSLNLSLANLSMKQQGLQ